MIFANSPLLVPNVHIIRHRVVKVLPSAHTYASKAIYVVVEAFVVYQQLVNRLLTIVQYMRWLYYLLYYIRVDAPVFVFDSTFLISYLELVFEAIDELETGLDL